MSDLTINQVREKRAEAEKRIGEILLQLTQETGLRVADVGTTTDCIQALGHPPMVYAVNASIRLESP